MSNSSNTTINLGYVKCRNIYYLTRAPTGSTFATYVTVATVLPILAFVTSLGNGLVIYVYFKQKSLQHSNILLLICLAFMDFTTGALLEPLYMIRLLSELFDFTSCTYILVVRRLFEFLRPVSFITMALITSERYLALFRPVLHRHLVTKRRILCTVLCSWFGWFLLVLIRTFSEKMSLAFYAISTFIAIALLLVNVGMYFKIGRLARFHVKSIRPQISFVNSENRTPARVRGRVSDMKTGHAEEPLRLSLNGEPRKPQIRDNSIETRSHVQDPIGDGLSRKERKAASREKYATWTVFYILIALFVCFIPESVILVYVSLTIDNLDFDLLFIYVHITETIVMFNAMINPFIYCLRNRKMRAAVKACCGIGTDARLARRLADTSQSEGK